MTTAPHQAPDDPRLADFARALGKTGWGATLFDSDWCLVWVSGELQRLLGTTDADELGFGRNMLEVFALPHWARATTDASRRSMFELTLPYLLAELPDCRRTLAAVFDDGPLAALIADAEPVDPPAAWSYHLEYLEGELPPVHTHAVAIRLRDERGDLLGTALIYGSGLPAGLLSMLVRGDERLVRRMARLSEPARHRVAILFADLERSSKLSRHLPSAVYFRLIQAMTTEIDSCVLECGGLIGKHAGDGVTAFFLAEEAGSDSATARAAIEAGRGIGEVPHSAVSQIEPEAGPLGADPIVINVGVHWSDTVYMGQLVTGGRLEVTALGDEVNECARIQQCARGGALLGSKPLIERLDRDDSDALGIMPDRLAYRTLSELPDADEKAVRDAGTIPVARLERA